MRAEIARSVTYGPPDAERMLLTLRGTVAQAEQQYRRLGYGTLADQLLVYVDDLEATTPEAVVEATRSVARYLRNQAIAVERPL
jgi:hypothetical protein